MGALKVLVVVMGVLIVGGTVTVGVLIVQRASGAAGVPPPISAGLGQPAGTRMLGIAAAGEGRVAILLQRPDGDRLLVLDGRTGRVVGEVRPGE